MPSIAIIHQLVPDHRRPPRASYWITRTPSISGSFPPCRYNVSSAVNPISPTRMEIDHLQKQANPRILHIFPPEQCSLSTLLGPLYETHLPFWVLDSTLLALQRVRYIDMPFRFTLIMTLIFVLPLLPLVTPAPPAYDCGVPEPDRTIPSIRGCAPTFAEIQGEPHYDQKRLWLMGHAPWIYRRRGPSSPYPLLCFGRWISRYERKWGAP